MVKTGENQRKGFAKALSYGIISRLAKKHAGGTEDGVREKDFDISR